MFTFKMYLVNFKMAFFRSKWATDKYSMGSYSFRSVETEANNVSHGQLAQPLLNSFGQPVSKNISSLNILTWADACVSCLYLKGFGEKQRQSTIPIFFLLVHSVGFSEYYQMTTMSYS